MKEEGTEQIAPWYLQRTWASVTYEEDISLVEIQALTLSGFSCFQQDLFQSDNNLS